MDKVDKSEPEPRAAIDALRPRIEAAFTGLSFGSRSSAALTLRRLL